MNENYYPNAESMDTISKNEVAMNEHRVQERPETKEVTSIVNQFEFFGLASVIYSIFYCFCLYQNNSGITMPFFVAGSFAYLIIALKKMEIPLKKDSWFYITAAVLLGISNCLTDSWVLIIFNTVGLWLLIISFSIHQFYHDEKWTLGKQFQALIITFFCTIGQIEYPFRSIAIFTKKRREKQQEKNSNAKYIWIGILIAVPLLFIISGLLVSADAVFRNIVGDIFKYIRIPQYFVRIIFMILFGIFFSYCGLIELSKGRLAQDATDKRTWEPLIAITVTSLMTILYLFFSIIQIVYLFGGNKLLPSNYTYAEYAREGFFQLLFVCMINLFVVLICLEKFRANKILKGILTIFSVCTYIMIASSVFRMFMYIDNYYLTFLRVFVLFMLLLITLLLTGLLISIYIEAFPLFRYSFVITSVLYLVFSLSKPDYFIAKYNVNHFIANESEAKPEKEDKRYSEFGYVYDSKGGRMDVEYLINNLSLDAAPILKEVNLFTGTQQHNYQKKIKRKTENMGIRSFNFSRNTAKKLFNIT